MGKKYSKEQIFDKLVEILSEEFEIDKDSITSEANLFTDLEMDSIDAVDLAVRLQQYSEKRISPEEFKQIRTINDVVEAIYSIL
ncbi:acyl carrier protein [bacterium]|nr:acyl carrier protein [bacterium]